MSHEAMNASGAGNPVQVRLTARLTNCQNRMMSAPAEMSTTFRPILDVSSSHSVISWRPKMSLPPHLPGLRITRFTCRLCTIGTFSPSGRNDKQMKMRDSGDRTSRLVDGWRPDSTCQMSTLLFRITHRDVVS